MILSNLISYGILELIAISRDNQVRLKWILNGKFKSPIALFNLFRVRNEGELIFYDRNINHV